MLVVKDFECCLVEDFHRVTRGLAVAIATAAKTTAAQAGHIPGS